MLCHSPFTRTAARPLALIGVLAAALLLLPACSEQVVPPRIDQIAPDPPHAMEFVHRAKTAYAFTTPSGTGRLELWWRSTSRDGVVDHPATIVDAAVDGGRFDALLTSCEALRFFRYPIRASVVHNGRQELCRLDFEDEEILHAGTVRPASILDPGRDVTLQQARYFFRSNPLFAPGSGMYFPPPTMTADVVMELHGRLLP